MGYFPKAFQTRTILWPASFSCFFKFFPRVFLIYLCFFVFFFCPKAVVSRPGNHFSVFFPSRKLIFLKKAEKTVSEQNKSRKHTEKNTSRKKQKKQKTSRLQMGQFLRLRPFCGLLVFLFFSNVFLLENCSLLLLWTVL